jgi:homocitrate synthase NifV
LRDDSVQAGSTGRVELWDVTLREGEQAPNAAFTINEKIAIAGALERAGIDGIQFGGHSRDGESVRRLRGEGIRLPVEMVCLAFEPRWQDEVRLGLEDGADVIQCIVRSSDDLIAQMGSDRDRVLERACAHIAYARAHGARDVTFAPSFCFDADRAYLERLCIAAVASGATRVQLVDTLGTAQPSEVARAVTLISGVVDVGVGVGAHDDFGLATASTLAAVGAGATRVDVSVNGLGERAGHAALEQVAAALVILSKRHVGFDISQLARICALVAGVLHTEVHADSPIVGSHAFANQLESHVRVAAERPELFEPFSPSLVGRSRSILLGSGSGPFAVETKAREVGFNDVSAEVLAELVDWVREQSQATKRSVPEERFAERAAQLLQAHASAGVPSRST